MPSRSSTHFCTGLTAPSMVLPSTWFIFFILFIAPYFSKLLDVKIINLFPRSSGQFRMQEYFKCIKNIIITIIFATLNIAIHHVLQFFRSLYIRRYSQLSTNALQQAERKEPFSWENLLFHMRTKFLGMHEIIKMSLKHVHITNLIEQSAKPSRKLFGRVCAPRSIGKTQPPEYK
ncbi:hypothetical protein ABEB36_013205 [Hypothenemus hampei]|uniref:Uncharacterized protein n=1 Tax=Hypothenemus hampei TaxID=57062 RepID=A0ABD1E766_HYPHA